MLLYWVIPAGVIAVAIWGLTIYRMIRRQRAIDEDPSRALMRNAFLITKQSDLLGRQATPPEETYDPNND